MNPSNSLILPLFFTSTASSASTHIGSVDTIGYDYLRFSMTVASASAAETAVTTLQVCESDDTTPLTAYTDGDAVTAFVGAAATSTSAGFVLPARSSTKENSYTMNIDLKGRKRYLGLYFAPTLECTEGTLSMVAVLGRAEDSTSIATAATSVDGCRLIVSG